MKILKPTEDMFTDSILMMMSSTFDRWYPESDIETISALVDSAKLTAQGIAQKLIESIDRHPHLDREIWSRLVEDATRWAVIEIGDNEPLMRLGKNPSFTEAVASCTGELIAPAGSDWAGAIQAEKEEGLRAYLRARGVQDREIDGLIKQLRTLEPI